jgi:hypothetical protein
MTALAPAQDAMSTKYAHDSDEDTSMDVRKAWIEQ